MAPSALPIRYDITIYQGADVEFYPRIWWDDAGTPTVLDTTGWTARMAVKESKEDTTYLLDSDVGDITFVMGLGTTDSGEDYSLQVAIPGANTEGDTFTGLRGYYDLWLTDTSARKLPYFTGTFCVDGQVSNG